VSQLHLFNPQHDHWRDKLDRALLECWQCRNWTGTTGASYGRWAVWFFAALLHNAGQLPIERYRRLIRFQQAYIRHLQAVERLEQAGRWRVIESA